MKGVCCFTFSVKCCVVWKLFKSLPRTALVSNHQFSEIRSELHTSRKPEIKLNSQLTLDLNQSGINSPEHEDCEVGAPGLGVTGLVRSSHVAKNSSEGSGLRMRELCSLFQHPETSNMFSLWCEVSFEFIPRIFSWVRFEAMFSSWCSWRHGSVQNTVVPQPNSYQTNCVLSIADCSCWMGRNYCSLQCLLLLTCLALRTHKLKWWIWFTLDLWKGEGVTQTRNCFRYSRHIRERTAPTFTDHCHTRRSNLTSLHQRDKLIAEKQRTVESADRNEFAHQGLRGSSKTWQEVKELRAMET